MAPEYPADLVVLDLQFEDGELVGKVDVVERASNARDERLHVTWNAEELPKDFFPVAGGAVSVANKPETIKVNYRVKPDVVGNRRYAWTYNSYSDVMMMVIVFPEGYVPDDCQPYPDRAKTFTGRAVAYWRFGEHGAEVRWTMRQSRELTKEAIQINQKAVRKPNPAIGAVIVDAASAARAQFGVSTILLGLLSLAFLMLLIFYGPKDLPSDYKPIVRFIAALAGGLLAGSFTGRLSLEGRLPAFADGIAGNSLGLAAAGGFAVFVFVMLFWAR